MFYVVKNGKRYLSLPFLSHRGAVDFIHTFPVRKWPEYSVEETLPERAKGRETCSQTTR